jgi:hypothetical protein
VDVDVDWMWIGCGLDVDRHRLHQSSSLGALVSSFSSSSLSHLVRLLLSISA